MRQIRGSRHRIRALRWRANTPFRVWLVFVLLLLAVIVGLAIITGGAE